MMLLVSIPVRAETMAFFGSAIDYWAYPGGGEMAKDQPEPEDKRSAFPWEKYLDPKNDEFFKEGNYVPPEPFMELARNPSHENIRHWFSYIEKKNEVAKRLQQRLQAYATKSHPHIVLPEKEVKEGRAVQAESIQDPRRFRFRLYFDSHCPHCERMMATMESLKNMGFAVELRQVDDGNLRATRMPAIPVKASRKEVSDQRVPAVPFLLIADLEKKTVYRLSGFQTVDEILGKLKSQ